MQTLQIAPTFNNLNNSVKKTYNIKYYNNVSFGIVPAQPESKFFVPLKKFIDRIIGKPYDKFVDSIAKLFGKLLDTDVALNLIKKTSKKDNSSSNVLSNLSTLGSVILSGLYVKKTLDNDKLDPNKKKTLAINQASVWGISTILGYTFNGIVNKKVDKFASEFEKRNQGNEHLGKYIEGIKIAKTVMIFDIVYRYFAPVVVTPIANHIGNKLQEKKEDELADRIRKND